MSWHQYYSNSTYGRNVHSYDPYFDDDGGDVKPAVVEHWRRDQAAYGFPGAVDEDVKPAKQPRAPAGGGAGGRRVHDGGDGTVPSWPAAEQFRSTLRTQESLAGLRARYGVPEGFGLLPAGASQAACDPPPPPRRARGGAAASAVPICVYEQAFAAGMRLPLHPFVAGALAHYGIAPSQLAPNGWRVLVAFAVLCHFRGAGAPSLPVFRHFFALAPLPKAKGWYSFRGRESVPALFTGLPNSTKTWKEEFLLVSPPPGAPWRCPVRWGEPSKEATSDPALTEAEAAVARRLAQGHGVVGLKTYLSESNLVAAKISRVPACSGTEASRVQPSPPAKKKKAAATASVAAAGGGGPSGEALRSELQAKERALAQAKGKISKLEEELGKAKARELAEARQALAYERQLGTQVIKAEVGKGAGAGKRRRGAQ
ncbi:transcription initiation factor TFIID subunit 4-like [Panicum virgatum]|uniref:Transposase (putative) gypsy type domain-containing protein n=1 Tax=Panicum virgatum TaxID=38727 RepID=A0A8T0XLP7_PANVG|nr:transcription initiation factor TFIID subunit 4-like [Panicum virgatum]KAG2658113.1 hypothetical protein PVAP13_1KG260505 [Panicum virgatum]